MLEFLRSIAPITERVDVMLEAKLKDGALSALMEDLARYREEGVEILDGASVRIQP
ncbi:hypothetical protein ACL02P_21320 [Paenibacillus sp. MB22_1]|uniref:hypothetical protein n=1 Tax=Paenibacillus TaxID=44249 RepID=UPI0001AFD55A|nr:hypothetical protein POTG_04222 [Paenibacillus sp. oral taxon 786 str. D14]